MLRSDSDKKDVAYICSVILLIVMFGFFFVFYH